MRTPTIAVTVLGAVAALLSTAGVAQAAPAYDARARLSGHATCSRDAGLGITRRVLVLDNTRSAHRVQFHVVRAGDRVAPHLVYVWVPAHRSRSVVVSVAQRTTVSVRVRVPEMGVGNLRLSATVPALDSCYVATLDPRASLGGVSCNGRDSVARIVLDNRSTSDDQVDYTLASSYGDSSASLTVDPASATNYYLAVPRGGSTHVDVAAAGRRLLSTEVAAINCG